MKRLENTLIILSIILIGLLPILASGRNNTRKDVETLIITNKDEILLTCKIDCLVEIEISNKDGQSIYWLSFSIPSYKVEYIEPLTVESFETMGILTITSTPLNPDYRITDNLITRVITY